MVVIRISAGIPLATQMVADSTRIVGTRVVTAVTGRLHRPQTSSLAVQVLESPRGISVYLHIVVILRFVLFSGGAGLYRAIGFVWGIGRVGLLLARSRGRGRGRVVAIRIPRPPIFHSRGSNATLAVESRADAARDRSGPLGATHRHRRYVR